MEPFTLYQNIMLDSGAGATSILPDMLAPTLAQLIADHGVEFAKLALTKLLTAEHGDAHWRAVVWGAHVETDTDLGSDLRVEMMDEAEANARRREWEVPWHIVVNQRPAVFRRPFSVSPILLCLGGENSDLKMASTMDILNRLTEEVQALGALTVSPILFEQRSAKFDDVHLEAFAAMSNYRGHRETTPLKSIEPVSLDMEAKRYLEAFRALADAPRTRVLTILDRLNTAKSRIRATDQALDACIALEMLLTAKGDSQGGIVHRLGLRAAFYLGTSLEERRQLQSDVRSAYTLRSKAAHGGSKSKGQDDDATAATAIGIANRLIRKMVREGFNVDWQTLELAPPQFSS